MIRSLYTSATGLQHQQRRLHASAHNTANATTPADATVPLRTSGTERAAGGVDSHSQRVATTDALRESVVQIDSAQAVAANVRAVQTQDEMLGALLDIEV